MSIWQNVLPGVDGKSPYISEDKRWMAWSDVDQKYYDAGPAVPVKGEDYWTDDDREELAKEAAKDVGIKVDELVARAEITLERAETAAEKAEEATEKIEGSAALIDQHTQEIAAAQGGIAANAEAIEATNRALEAGLGKKDLLWQNANTSVAFNPQTITLSEDEYDDYIIVTAFGMSTRPEYYVQKHVSWLLKNDSVNIITPFSTLGQTSERYRHGLRNVTMSGNNVIFGDNLYASTVQNGYTIPVAIYGIKY